MPDRVDLPAADRPIQLDFIIHIIVDRLTSAANSLGSAEPFLVAGLLANLHFW